MKAYTSLEQSKKLAEILPLESADMALCGKIQPLMTDYMSAKKKFSNAGEIPIDPCWSLSALLDYLTANFRTDIKYLDNYWELDCRVQVTYSKELVDACYEMIVKLHEQKVL